MTKHKAQKTIITITTMPATCKVLVGCLAVASTAISFSTVPNNRPRGSNVVVTSRLTQLFAEPDPNDPREDHSNEALSLMTDTADMNASSPSSPSSPPRAEFLGSTLRSLVQLDDTLSVGSTVVPTTDIPSLGIWQWQSYEIKGIVDQSANLSENGLVNTVQRNNLNEPIEPTASRYVVLYSPKFHGGDNSGLDGPVKVLADDVKLQSMKKEVADSVYMALPLFGFWTALAWTFANQYTDRYGGTLWDAFWGR